MRKHYLLFSRAFDFNVFNSKFSSNAIPGIPLLGICIAVLLSFNANAQVTDAQKTATVIGGKVISFEESFPLEGVRILVKGTRNITGTQVDGTFSLTINTGDKILVVSSGGYETQEIKITNARDYEIVLRRSNDPTNRAALKNNRF